jgi:hypothetical protein
MTDSNTRLDPVERTQDRVGSVGHVFGGGPDEE